MRLQDVREKSQFEAFYAANNLKTSKQKIDFLKKEMGIIASHSIENLTEDEEISTLQQFALYDWDRISHSNNFSVNVYDVMQKFLADLEECVKYPDNVKYPCGDMHIGSMCWRDKYWINELWYWRNKYWSKELCLDFYENHVKIFIGDKLVSETEYSEIIDKGLPLYCIPYVLESGITAKFIRKVLSEPGDFTTEAKKHLELGYISQRIFEQIVAKNCKQSPQDIFK